MRRRYPLGKRGSWDKCWSGRVGGREGVRSEGLGGLGYCGLLILCV